MEWTCESENCVRKNEFSIFIRHQIKIKCQRQWRRDLTKMFSNLVFFILCVTQVSECVYKPYLINGMGTLGAFVCLFFRWNLFLYNRKSSLSYFFKGVRVRGSYKQDEGWWDIYSLYVENVLDDKWKILGNLKEMLVWLSIFKQLSILSYKYAYNEISQMKSI